MGFFFGFLLVNVFMCYLEEELFDNGLIFFFYKCYVDDMFVIMFGVDVVENFFDVFNGFYFSIYFIMEFFNNDLIFFIGMLIIKNGNKLEI